MEPASLPVAKGRGLDRGPRGPRERPRPTSIPVLEREVRRLRHRSRPSSSAARRPETEFHRLPPQAGRLRPSASPNVQMIPGSSLPMGGITPEQMEAFADGIEKYAPAQQGPHHHAPEHPDPPHCARRRGQVHPRAVPTPGCRAARACGNTVRNVTGDPVGRPWRPTSSSDLNPVRGAPTVRYFVRHPTTQLMAAQGSRRRSTPPTRIARADRHPRHRVHRARARRRARPSRSRSAAATSIMPRIAPDALRLRRPRRRRVPGKWPRPSFASSTARNGCAGEPRPRPAPGSRSLVDQDRRRRGFRRLVDEERQGATGSTSARGFDVRRPAPRRSTEEGPRPPEVPSSVRLAKTATAALRSLPCVERHRPGAQEGFSGGAGPRAPAADLRPRASSAPWPDIARKVLGRSGCATTVPPEPAAALGYADETVLRGPGRPCASLGPRRRGAPTRSADVVSCPGD